jgi:hypothetical protein
MYFLLFSCPCETWFFTPRENQLDPSERKYRRVPKIACWREAWVVFPENITKVIMEYGMGGACRTHVNKEGCIDSNWNVMAHSDAWEGKWRRNWRMEWVASTLYTTSDHGASSITTADAHTSTASNLLNWRPHPPADLNGLVRFAERRNLVSARVPSHFKRSLPFSLLIWMEEQWNLFSIRIYGGTSKKRGTWWCSWLRHCATSRKVAGWSPDVIGFFFHWHNPSGRTVALGLTQPLTEMSTRNISWGVKAAGT